MPKAPGLPRRGRAAASSSPAKAKPRRRGDDRPGVILVEVEREVEVAERGRRACRTMACDQERHRWLRESSGSRLTARDVRASDFLRALGAGARLPGKTIGRDVDGSAPAPPSPGRRSGWSRSARAGSPRPGCRASARHSPHQRLRLHPELVLAPHRRRCDVARRLQPRRRQVHVQRHREVAQRRAVQAGHRCPASPRSARPRCSWPVRLVDQPQRRRGSLSSRPCSVIRSE